MSFTEKIDVLELLLNLLEEHEQELDSLVEKLEIVNQAITQSPLYGNSQNNESTVFDNELYKNLLIVDDDENLAKTFKLILENAGFNVDIAYRGINAINMINQKLYDLLIIDINLPDMLGYAIVENMEMNGTHTDYILITGYSSLKNDLDSQLEYSEVLLKPITPEKLIEVTTKYTSQNEIQARS